MKKRCSQCHKSKPATEFYKDKSAYDGLSSSCKSCESKRDKARRGRQAKSHKDAVKALAKLYPWNS